MDSHDQLMIRACKRFHGERLLKRLRKIYARRVAISEKSILNDCVFEWMMNVANSTLRPIHPIDLVTNAHPTNGWKYGCEGGDYWERFIAVIASHLRLKEIKHIPGYRPMKFRS